MSFKQVGVCLAAGVLAGGLWSGVLQAQPSAAPPPPTAAEIAAPAAQSPASVTPPPPAATQDLTPSAAGAPAASGPIIELPPEIQPAPAPSSGVQLGTPSDSDTLLRGLGPSRLTQPRTVVGGYGQFTMNVDRAGTQGEYDAKASVRRLVLFIAHPITDDIRIYTEFEWENALACASCTGSAEVEQAFVNWRLAGDLLALRVGLVLVPMGIINEWHEPPVFHGVERPMVDQLIIPSTWRELGVGFVGNYQQRLRYQLYFTTTLNPARLSETGLANARTLGSMAPAKAFAVTGRAEYEPFLGVIAGASFFLSDVGNNGDYYDSRMRQHDLSLPVLGYALDARMRRWGFEARAVWAQFFLPNSGDLIQALHDDGSPLFPRDATVGTVPTRLQGGYVELAYDVLSLAHVSHELYAFLRLEYYDTQAGVPKGYAKNPELDINELTTGLTYRPVPQLAFKTDIQLRDKRLGLDVLQYNLGFGYMF
jgi:hypothetical protein